MGGRRTLQDEDASGEASQTVVLQHETEDQTRIRSALGTSYITVPYEQQSLQGRTVLIKYGIKLWYLATVISMGDDDTCSVMYEDHQEGTTQLSRQLFWDVSNSADAPRWSWLLLDEAPLSNHGTSHVTEGHRKDRGRGRTTRAAPSFGPTAKKPRRQTK